MVLGPLGGDDFAMLGWVFGATVVDRESLAVVLGTSVGPEAGDQDGLIFRNVEEVGAQGVGPVEERAVPLAEVVGALEGAGVVIAEMGRLRVGEEPGEALHAQLRLEERVDVRSEGQVLVERRRRGSELRHQVFQVFIAMEEDAIQSLGGLIAEQDLAREIGRAEQGGDQRLDGGGFAALGGLLLLGFGDLHVRDHPEAPDVGDDLAVQLVGGKGGLDVDGGAGGLGLEDAYAYPLGELDVEFARCREVIGLRGGLEYAQDVL